MRGIDSHALGEMKSGAKGRVPEDSGRLLNGITSSIDGDTSIFEASGVSPNGETENYARFVEFGHRSGHADASFFESDGAHALDTRPSSHAVVDPHPFFYPSVTGPLSDRLRQAEGLLDDFRDQVLGS